jgi:hypothetical protein
VDLGFKLGIDQEILQISAQATCHAQGAGSVTGRDLQKIKMTYKDLLNYSKFTQISCHESYTTGTKHDSYDVRIKSNTFTLQRHELRKLSETLNEAASSALKAYELGLYL